MDNKPSHCFLSKYGRALVRPNGIQKCCLRIRREMLRFSEYLAVGSLATGSHLAVVDQSDSRVSKKGLKFQGVICQYRRQAWQALCISKR